MTIELDTHLADLVARLADLQSRVSELTEQAEEIKAKLRANLDIGAYSIDGRPAVTITSTRRFSPTRAITVLPVELLALCQVSTVSAERARAVLPPAIFESCQEVSGKPQVRLT